MGATTKIFGNGITLQNKKFVREFVKDGKGNRAVAIAYPNIKNKDSIKVKAYKLINNPKIRELIIAEMRKQDIDESFIIGTLKAHAMAGIAIKADSKSSIKALEVLVKILGMDKQNKTYERSQTNYNFNFIGDIEGLPLDEVLKKRRELSKSFDEVIEDANIISPIA